MANQMIYNDETKKAFAKNAINSYRKSDKSRKMCGMWASRIVGNYEPGAVIGLADEMGLKGSDSVYMMAHAYMMFQELFTFEGGEFAKFAFLAWWRTPYIHYSHFNALWKARRDRGLTVPQIADLLMDIYQANGEISSRDVDQHARDKYGIKKTWADFASPVQSRLNTLLQQPDLPRHIRRAGNDLYELLGDEA